MTLNVVRQTQVNHQGNAVNALREVLKKAIEAQQGAICPYSNYPVGASLMVENNIIVIAFLHTLCIYGALLPMDENKAINRALKESSSVNSYHKTRICLHIYKNTRIRSWGSTCAADIRLQ